MHRRANPFVSDNHPSKRDRPDTKNRLNLAKKVQHLSTETHFIRLAIFVSIGCRTLPLKTSAMALFDEVSPLANFGR